jgi:hypothetical protein
MWAYHRQHNLPELAGCSTDIQKTIDAIAQYGPLQPAHPDPEAAEAFNAIHELIGFNLDVLNHARHELVRQDRTRALQQQRAELQAAADTHSSLAFRALKRAPPPPLEQIQHNGQSTTFLGHVVLHYGQVWAD